LRLRDMAGLIVIDFIDMEHGSNVRKVEKAIKEALKDDRARIQVGRISGFGLMEMSRQRLRTGVLEASTRACPHCEGTGLVRTASSAGLSALRMLEEEAARGRGSIITLRASQEAAFYVLNNKRRELDEIERRYGVTIVVLPDGEVEGARMSVEPSGPRPTMQVSYGPIVAEDAEEDLPVEEELDEDEDEDEDDEARADTAEGGDRGEAARKRKRRRRGRRGRREGEGEGEGEEQEPAERAAADAEGESDDESAEDGADEAPGERMRQDGDGEDGQARRSRRGRRGGRRRRGGREGAPDGGDTPREADEVERGGALAADDDDAGEPMPVPMTVEASGAAAGDVEEAPVAKRRRRSRKVVAEAEPAGGEAAGEAQAVPVELSPELAEAPVAEAEPSPAPKQRRTRRKAAPATVEAPETAEAPDTADAAPDPVATDAAPAAPKRTRRRKAEPAAALAETEATLVGDAVDVAEPAEPAPAAAVEAAPVEPVAGQAEPEATQAEPEDDAGGTPRRGWWQRTFGA
jgi:ribonuclease E